jgi:hypothetical protein
MGNVRMDRNEPDCVVTHDLINRLTVIVICCDLLTEGPDEDSERRRRLQMIRTSAKAIAKQLDEHECDIERILPIATTMRRQVPS